MDLKFIGEAIAIVLIGTILLRIAGRKTISEMTLAETVLMISIGTLIIQPVTSKSVWQSFLIGLILVITLLILEYIQLKSSHLEKLISGKAKIVIENGHINEKELLKLHLTINQLKMYLRQNNIASLDDVQIATLEPSGRLGFTLKPDARPATKGDLQKLQFAVEQLTEHLVGANTFTEKKSYPHETNKRNLFTEVKDEK